MDTASLAAFAGTATSLVGGSLLILKVLVDRHLSALTRLEARAEANTEIQSRIALAFDAVREQLTDVRRTGDRTAINVRRILDHMLIPETESAPMPAPSEVPRSASITGQHLAWAEHGAPGGAAGSSPRRG